MASASQLPIGPTARRRDSAAVPQLEVVRGAHPSPSRVLRAQLHRVAVAMPQPREAMLAQPVRCHRPRSPSGQRVRLKPARAVGLAPWASKEWSSRVRALLAAWRELARGQARQGRLLARGLRRQARNRMLAVLRHWARCHERDKRREVDQRMQRQAEARTAAERRALVRCFPRTLRGTMDISGNALLNARTCRTPRRHWNERVARPHPCGALRVGTSDVGGEADPIPSPRARRHTASHLQNTASQLRSVARRRQNSVSRP